MLVETIVTPRPAVPKKGTECGNKYPPEITLNYE